MSFRLLISAFLLLLATSAIGQEYVPGRAEVPGVPCEFRAAWIASVLNIDWPSKKGLSVARQQQELRRILDRARDIGLNAVILQVRPAADALYNSPHEPWSEYLSGRMGRAPSPYYDPLEFAIAEAHERGLELHAWFNPFRARHNEKSAASADHITRTRPDIIRRYGGYHWMDPATPEARDIAEKVILDVTRRYDVDGIHLDDYFYPYQIKGKNGRKIDFPDDVTWNAYRQNGGRLPRDAWRRSHVDDLVERLYKGIKRIKPEVKFGISPFGIWRPGHPRGIEADLDAYVELAADARRWMHEGWLDYCTPQLYWTIDRRPQSYSALLDWWAGENRSRRHMWPGIASARVGSDRKAGEMLRQIDLARRDRRVTGHVHWNMAALMSNKGGVTKLLTERAYGERALVPESPWLGRRGIKSPRVAFQQGVFTWSKPERDHRFWILQTRSGGKWTTQILPASKTNWTPGEVPIEAIAVSGLNRTGQQSRPTVLVRR